MLARLARFAYRRRRLMVFGIWLPLLVVISAIGGKMASYHTSFELPHSESRQVTDLLTSVNEASKGGAVAQIVFSAPQGTKDPAVVQTMTSIFDKVAKIPNISVVSPYSVEGARFNSAAKPISFAEIHFTVKGQAEQLSLANQIKDIGAAARAPGLEIQYGGQLFGQFEFPPSEALGLIAAVIILLVAFGSVLAMGLPVGTALFGLATGIGLVGIGSRLLSMPEFSTQMAAMIGLGVGIDYALFIVTRYREGLREGLNPEEATVQAVDTSGRAVLFAGVTVMVSLLGLFVVGISFVRGLAVAGALAVLVMVAASLSLLPAFLGMAGRRIDVTTRAAAGAVGLAVLASIVAIITSQIIVFGVGVLFGLAMWGFSFLPSMRGLRTPIPGHREKPKEQQFWWRWSRMVQRRPWMPFLGGAAVLVVLALPLLSIRLGFGDTGNLPKNYTARKAYDLLADGFGPGFGSPLILVSDDAKATPESLAAVTKAVAADPNVAFASPAVPVKNGISLWQVYPKTSAQDKATTDLVNRLRSSVLPTTGLAVKVGGFTAGSIDFAAYLGSRLPILIGGVLIVSFLLLMIVFRSLLVPLKAVIMNLLSVGAAYGVIVAIFQWGWGASLIGVGKAGPVEAWAPMMLFAIVFGLSMDYEVFLLSRMKEEFDRTGDNASAVADGLAVTARVITAAAIIMVCVFSAFVLGVDRQLKLFGLGMAVAVFVDATIVRMILVPATMELLGARNWWIPAWLDRILPRVDVEGSHADRSSHDSEDGPRGDGTGERELVGVD
jgi:RND superfamily putative drug exporter